MQKPTQKSLLAALAISAGNKAITKIDDNQCLIVERRWAGDDDYYIAHLVDLKEGKVIDCRDKLVGPDALQDWADNCVFDVTIDILDKRWSSMEEVMLQKTVNTLAEWMVKNVGIR